MVDEFNTDSQDDILIEQAGAFAGEADGFGRLWTPHRMAYIEGERPTKDAGHGCPFCASPTKTDADGLIVHRGEHCFVVMNLFPYNPGHLLVCPYRHVASYIDLTDDETEEFTKLTKAGVRAPSGPKNTSASPVSARCSATDAMSRTSAVIDRCSCSRVGMPSGPRQLSAAVSQAQIDVVMPPSRRCSRASTG